MSHADQPPPAQGATPIRDDERRRRGGAWWLWLLLALVALVILLLVLSRCGGDDDGDGSGTNATGSATTTATESAPTATTSATASQPPSSTASSSTSTGAAPSPSASAGSGGGAGGAGDLTAAGTSLLPLSAAAPGGDLSAYAGKPVRATGVTVQSVPADEGFWVGTSTTDRIWVQLNGTGESSYQVKEGDHVDFSGRMVENTTGFPASVGVTSAEGADLLDSQMAHIKVRAGAVKLSN